MPRLKDFSKAVLQLALFALCTVMVLTSFPWPVDAQIYVYPRRPNQSNVRYFDFEWHYKDIEIGPEADSSDIDGFNPGQALEAMARSLRKDGEATTTESTASPIRRHGQVDFHSSSPPMGYVDFPDPAEDTGTDPPEPELRANDEEDTDGEEIEPAFEATDLSDRQGGVRLYFYEREREIAERAAAFIEESYRELVEDFQHVPRRTLPYILYNTYQEFLQTNIFPIQEGVLGVTGRADLELVLPYFGDHRLFQHISTHEMVHQFQIQKARDVVRDAGLSGDPLDRMPLWFIEGMAEFYALGGLDPEAEMLTRDLLLNPDPTQGYVILDFFEDRPFSQLWTYKIGQARVAFLEDHYGEGTIQEVFNRSYRLVGAREGQTDTKTFRSLLADITGDPARKISAEFEAWIKRRSYETYLDSSQDAQDLTFFNDTRGYLQTMASSPNGHLIMYRSIQRSTGQVRLFLTDSRAPRRHHRVASDGQPGAESLHPVGPRNFDVHNDQAVYFARSKGRDLLYLKEVRHRAEEDGDGSWNVRIRTRSRGTYDLSEHGLVTAESPAFSPDGRRIAFLGLDEEGQKDLYIFQALEGDDFMVTRLTDDAYAERGVSWGPDGVVYASDATGHGRYNLFRIDPDSGDGTPERLTFEARDHFDPRAMADGRIFFSAFTGSRANIYEWTGEDLARRTDMVTGVFDVSPGPNDSLWTTFHYRGQRRVVRISADNLVQDEQLAQEDDPDQAAPFPTLSLDTASPYRATELGNWQVSNIFGLLGASSAGVFGQLMFLANDRLRNHALFINVLAFGDLNNTLADVLYLNQESRLIWGTGLFQDVRYRIDDTLVPTEELFGHPFSGERFYGGRATVRYPFDRFTFIQADLAVGGVAFFLQDRVRDNVTSDSLQQWEQTFDSHRFQASPSVSLGYNTIRLHPGTGPIDGSSALLESTVDVQPFDDEVHGTVRLDAERYFPIYDRINFSLRMGAGSTFGGELARQFFLSSFDTLRGVEFADTRFLLGSRFFFSKAELRFPLNFLLRVPLIDIEGMVGADFGGVGEDLSDLWEWRVFSPVAGFNFGLGPLVFRLHFARPIDIGAPEVPNNGNWVTNFSLGWRYW